jgi:hypothetical protein
VSSMFSWFLVGKILVPSPRSNQHPYAAIQ